MTQESFQMINDSPIKILANVSKLWYTLEPTYQAFDKFQLQYAIFLFYAKMLLLFPLSIIILINKIREHQNFHTYYCVQQFETQKSQIGCCTTNFFFFAL